MKWFLFFISKYYYWIYCELFVFVKIQLKKKKKWKIHVLIAILNLILHMHFCLPISKANGIYHFNSIGISWNVYEIFFFFTYFVVCVCMNFCCFWPNSETKWKFVCRTYMRFLNLTCVFVFFTFTFTSYVWLYVAQERTSNKILGFIFSNNKNAIMKGNLDYCEKYVVVSHGNT